MSTFDNLGIYWNIPNLSESYLFRSPGFIKQQLDTCQFLRSSLQKQYRGEPEKSAAELEHALQNAFITPFHHILHTERVINGDALPIPNMKVSGPAKLRIQKKSCQLQVGHEDSIARVGKIGDKLEIFWGIGNFGHPIPSHPSHPSHHSVLMVEDLGQLLHPELFEEIGRFRRTWSGFFLGIFRTSSGCQTGWNPEMMLVDFRRKL